MRRKCLFLGKKMISAVIACALVLLPVTPASAATARATTMKLEKTEGTVTLKTQNGTARKITNGMRLYNGNTLKTEKYSYAYVNLDNTKAVKLDQSSSATLRQSGKELELLVKSGKLFFNVSKPLTEKEQMNVRTSTMVTGIRGTCGVVEYMTPNKSRLYLIEGRVTLGSGENATTIQGGQTATVVLQEKQTSGGTEQPGDKPGDTDKPSETDKTGKEMEQKVLVEQMTEENIPPVALQEIVNDPILQEKIEQTTELKLDKIEEALEKFEKEEAERKEQEKAEQEKENEKEETKEPEKKPEENKEQDSGNTYIPSDSGNSGGSGGAAIIKETTLDGAVTIAMIDEAFKEYQRVHIGAKAKMECAASDILNIPGGKMLHIWGNQTIPATINVGDGKTQGLLCIVDSTSPIASLTAGTINVAANSRLENHGTLSCASLTGGENATLINNKSLTVNGVMSLSSGAKYYNDGPMQGTDLHSESGAVIRNWNVIKLSGAYTSPDTNVYEHNDAAILISKSKSTGLSSDWLLLTAENTATTDTSQPEYYYYSIIMSKLLVDNLYRDTSKSICYNFHKEAVISPYETVELDNFRANMNDTWFYVRGGLVLADNVNITGNGATATMYVSGGSLVLGKTSGSANSVIENTGNGYAIKHTNGTVQWNDVGFTVKATTVDKTIQGISQDAEGIVNTSSAGYCTFKTDYLPEWNANAKVLSLTRLPATFSTTDDNPTVARIKTALVNYSTVTVGSDVSVSMLTNESVTVPAGKKLTITTKSFNMSKGSGIQINDGGTLEVSGTINVVSGGTSPEPATITVGSSESNSSSATLKVSSSGYVMADEIYQNEKAVIYNEGIIDVGVMTTKGTSDQSGTITNHHLIKTKTFKAEGNLFKYEQNDESVFVCNDDLGTSSLTGVELLVSASTTQNDYETLQYFYARSLNTLMAERINNIKTTAGGDFQGNGASSWTFAKEAKINSAITIDFEGADVEMGDKQMRIAAKGVELDNIGNMTGTGNAVIYLTGAGSLTLGGTGEGTISNMTKEPGYYAIAASDDILKSQEAHLFWQNINLTIYSKKIQQLTTNPYIIQGYDKDDDCYLVPDAIEYAWVQYMDGNGYKASVDKSNLEVARLVPVEQ